MVTPYPAITDPWAIDQPFVSISRTAIDGSVNGSRYEMYCRYNGMPSNGQKTPVKERK